MNQIEISYRARLKWTENNPTRKFPALGHLMEDLRNGESTIKLELSSIPRQKLKKHLQELPDKSIISIFDTRGYAFGASKDVVCLQKEGINFKGIRFGRHVEMENAIDHIRVGAEELSLRLVQTSQARINVITENNYINLLDYDPQNSNNSTTETAGGQEMSQQGSSGVSATNWRYLLDFLQGKERDFPNWVKERASSPISSTTSTFNDYYEDLDGKLTLMYNKDSYCHRLKDKNDNYCDYLAIYAPTNGDSKVVGWRGNSLHNAVLISDFGDGVNLDDYLDNVLELSGNNDDWRFVQLDLPVDKAAQKVQNKNLTTNEGNTMSKIKTVATTALTANKNAVVTAAKIEAGRIATKQAVALVKPHLPLMVRGYAETPVGELVIANLFSLMIQNFAPQNEKAAIVADAMLNGAMLGAVQSLKVEQLINDVMSKVDISKFTETLTEEKE